MSDSATNTSDDDVVFIEQDDISNYNPDQILPEPPEQIRKIRAWLNPTEYTLDSGEFRKHLASHLAGTSAWFTSNDDYREWLKSKKDGLLWIKGIPGSGKSVLAAHLVNELAQSQSGTTVLYFFFRQIIDANHEPAALLRDWLDQILVHSPPLQKRLKELVKSGRSVNSITMEDHWSNLKLAIDGLPAQVFCIADALDEMDQGNDEFIRSLARFGQWKPDKAKVLITSRPVPTVETPLRNSRLLSIRLHEKEVDIDIEKYVEHGLRSTDIALSDQRLIKNAIPGRANGLFLYAKLALDAFLETDAHVDDVLQALPTDLHDMYTRLLREHATRSGVPQDIQLLILQWVTHATRPLRLLELAEMLDTTYRSEAGSDLKAKKNLVRAATGPLLEVLPDETVSVIHHSFTEYLKSEIRVEGDGGYPILRPGATHGCLAIACLSYLQSGCLDDVDIPGKEDVEAEDLWFDNDTACLHEEQQIRLRYPFFVYAATNWHIHVARSASAGLPQPEINTVVHNFLDNTARRKAWLKLQWSKQGSQVHSLTALHVAARYGLYDYARYLIHSGVDVDVLDTSGKTPLWFAASSGHADIIRLLVHAGADPDVDSQEDGMKPLHEAAAENRAEAVKALLEAGVDPLTKRTRDSPGNWCGNAPTSVGHTPLMYACKNGHMEALNTFIPFLHDLEAVHRALEWSAYKGRAKLVHRLLQCPGIQVNATPRGDTALVAACRSSSRNTIVTLIQAGADPTVLCENWGPEFGGIDSGREYYAVEQTEERGKRGFTALHALCSGFRYQGSKRFSAEEWQELVTLLIAKGADVNQKEHHGDTPLHCAVNTPVAVRLLLEAGADANAVNDAGKVPLHLVTSPESISLLIEIGHADMNISPRYHDGQSPTYILLNGYHVDATLRLLDYGPDLTLKDKDRSGPLHILLKQWSADVRVLKALLYAGADPNERNRLGETPLLCMRTNEPQSGALLHLLLEAGADVNAKDMKGLTVLSRAISGRSSCRAEDKELEVLLQNGADLNVRDFDGRTLLHIAIAFHEGKSLDRYSQNRLVKFDYLLQKGMDHTAVDYRGNTLLHELALKDRVLHSSCGLDYLAIAMQLLALGIDPDQRNNAGRTAVHVLASRPSGEYHTYRSYSSVPGHQNIFELLISTSKNVDMSDNEGLTALHLASTVSELHVKILLDAGSDATIASFGGLTPLHLAARARQSNIVGQLLEACNNAKTDMVDLEDDKGNTALYYACRSGRPETVRLLLDAGADASHRSLVTACAEYETENALWSTAQSTTIAASGLTFDDTTRPISAFSGEVRYMELDPYKDTTRLDEILDMLIENGADVHKMHYSHPKRVGTTGSDYTADCFVRAKERHTEPSTFNTHGAPNTLFPEHAATIHREAQLRAVSEFNVVKGNRNRELVLHLLRQRQYHTMKLLFDKGVSFLEDVEKYTHRSNMHIFVRYGLASLVKQIGDLEAERLFGKGQWHAFDNSSRRGLHKNVALEDEKTTSIPALLQEAVKSTLPNMEVVRLLVERFHVGVNGVMHHLAWGTHWWHVAKALPYLISHGANVNIRDADNRGRSPLHVALSQANPSQCSVFHKEAARTLISAGADVNAQDEDGKSCLAYACSDNEMVKLLVQRGATVDANALFAAINYKLADVLDTLLSTGIDPNIHRQPESNSQGHGYGVSASKEFPLWVAAMRPDNEEEKTPSEKRVATDTALELVNLLLAHGADPYMMFERENPNHVSNLYDGDIEDADRVSSLISAEELGAEKKLQTVSILHDLLENGSLVHILLTFLDLDLQRRDCRGRTILHAACRSRPGVHVAPIDTLVPEIDPERQDSESEAPYFLYHLSSQGADVLARDNEGRNILHHMLAVPNRYRRSCHPIHRALILLSSADTTALINQKDVYGNTPLHLALRYAIWQSDASPAEALLTAGADPFAQDNRGNTALHILAYRVLESEASRSLLSRMLELGLDVNTRNASGQTPVFNLNKPMPSYISHLVDKKEEYITSAQALALFEDVGTDLFMRDKQGRGLLHVAARSTYIYCATSFELLVNKGLDAVMEDERKMTPLDVAAACDNQSVLKLFDKDNVRNKVTAGEVEFEPEYDSDDMGF